MGDVEMRAVAQRVKSAAVEIDGKEVAAISEGLLVYLGAEEGDTAKDVSYMANKLAGLRVFPNDAGKMSLSVKDGTTDVLVVSQFTLFGDMRKGLRPSFNLAAEPKVAEQLYESCVQEIREHGCKVQTGQFQKEMLVSAVVWGPVTIMIDSRKNF